LSGRPDQGRRRGEQQKELDRILARQSVEGEGPTELWVEDRPNASKVDFGGEAVIDRRRSVRNTPEGRLARSDRFEDPG
jgi:hypothetical protein